ncbi:GNAT family N-acetyltransferase [Paenibacillus sp. BK720]|uniref:GNAT family N-acetyltransferase n=1 Tax=Paenibacillus sp. BK720 TaxID=2587092 RepID=UPI001424757F|nr:GNAT family N-acetyltransferase [Paenibacillus sp. BK720]NIK69458.1 GNAT superfamily N-acetyltransferase [Paenibacillus sp. BK720]
MEHLYNHYRFSDDKSQLDLDAIQTFLAKSYWANHRTRETIEKSIRNSTCYGIYCEGKQIGFARVITDWATVYYLADVYIDEEHRGHGLGKELVGWIVKQYEGLSGLLGTLDAHGLYEQFGFRRNAERFMVRRP